MFRLAGKSTIAFYQEGALVSFIDSNVDFVKTLETESAALYLTSDSL